MSGFSSSTYGSRSIVVDNILELQTKRGIPNQKAFLMANTSSADRGVGEFVWDNSSTATADGVLVVQTTGVTTGRWLRYVPDQVYRAVWWAVVGDGSNQAVRINAALTAMPAGATLIFEKAVTYTITAAIITTKAVTIEGNDCTIAYTGGAAIKVIQIGADNTTIQNLKMTGDSLVYSALTRHLIANSVTGLSNVVSRKNIIIRNCDLSNYGGSGVYLKWVEGFRIENCKLHGFSYAGADVISCTQGFISYNEVYDVVITSPGVNAYGLEMHHDTIGDVRCENITVSHNTITGNDWEGLDTHGGININFLDNHIINCTTGIAIVSGSGVAPEHFNCSGNIVTYDNSVVEAPGAAIRVDGISAAVPATGVVSQNVCFGSNIKVEYVEGLIISNNRVEQSSAINGILLNGDCLGVQVTNNMIIDCWDGLSNNTSAIQAVNGGNTKCYIAGNILVNGGFTVPSGSKNRYGFRPNVDSGSDEYIVGYNDFRVASVSEYDNTATIKFIYGNFEGMKRYTTINFTVLPEDLNIIYDYSAGGGTVTLPALSTQTHRRVIWISNASSGTLTFSPVVYKLNASSTSVLPTGTCCKLVYDNTNSKIWMFQL